MGTEPRAVTARYDQKLDRVVVDLTNGGTFAFPHPLAQGLEVATDEQLKEVKILGVEYGLNWESDFGDSLSNGKLAELRMSSESDARRRKCLPPKVRGPYKKRGVA